MICNLGCEILIAKDELKSHNCIKELRKVIDDQQSKINQLSNEVSKQKNDLDVYVNELRVLKVFNWLNLNYNNKYLFLLIYFILFG